MSVFGNNGVGVIREADPSLWGIFGCAEPFTARPRALFYSVKGHAQYCCADDTLTKHMHDVLCDVLRVRLLADTVTDELFTSVYISTSFPTSGVLGEEISFCDFPNQFSRFKIDIEQPSTLTQLWLPAVLVNSSSPTLKLIDLSLRVWRLNPIFDVERRIYIFNEDWAKFVSAKAFKVGDSLSFVTARDTGYTYFTARRAHSQSPLRQTINPQAVALAYGCLTQNLPVEVVFYSLDRSSCFLVNSRQFTLSLMVHWCPYLRVEMRSNIENQVHQGTIMKTTFTRAETGVLTTNPWHCLSIIWDRPGFSERLNFSPWEVYPVLQGSPQLLNLFPTGEGDA